MTSNAVHSRKFWRQLTSCIVIYALVLQNLLVGITGLRLALADRTNDGLPAFELCLHNADGSVPDPNDKPDIDACVHCKYCVLAAVQFLATPDSSRVLSVPVADTDEVFWLIADWRDEISAEYPSQRPRGPPLMA
jgi:hypothetical protein